MKYLVTLLLTLLLLLSCTDGERMRRELAGLQARNQADSLLTDDSLALAHNELCLNVGLPSDYNTYRQ